MSWDPNPIEEDLGRLQVIITDNTGVNFDVSYLNGVAVNVESIVSNEPFGDASAVVNIPQITPFQPPQRRYGEFPDIDIFLVRPDNSKITMFQGFIADWNSTLHGSDWMTQATCKGALYQYDLDIIPPPLYIPAAPLDVGKLVKDALDLKSTRVKPLVQVATNIFSMKATGSGQPLLTGYIQDLLSTATQADGGQWTLVLSDAANTNRQPVMRLKDTRTVHWSMACGAPGVEHELSYDSTTGVTTIYGEGIDPFGCFPATTEVKAQKIDAAYKRSWSGGLVHLLTATGRHLAATPNHPILTPLGWVKAGDLVPGDDVFSEAISDGVTSAEPHVVARPAPIGEIFHSLEELGDLARITGVGMDFHGDRSDGEVDVVWPHGLLRDHLEALGAEQLSETDFLSADIAEVGLMGECHACALLGGVAATSSFMGSESESVSFVGTHSHEAVLRAATLVANFDPMAEQDAPDGVVRDAEPLTEDVSGIAAEIALDKIQLVYFDSSWTGDVYNLQTDSGAYLAEGIIVHNCYWRNTKYPNLHADTAPVWPSPVLLTIGVTDAESNGAVSMWQRHMKEGGFPVTVTGTYNAADRNSCIFLEQVAGISVDGIVGPQTWAATFQAGSNQGSLDGAFFAPLYSDPRVEKYLYNPEGGITGTNPHYNPRVMRVEKWLNFGTGISKNLAIFMARIQYNRDRNPAWMGTITLTSDPDEGSRFQIRPGQNFQYKGFAGNVASLGGGLTTEAFTPGLALNSPIVGAAPAHAGYWLAAADGGVFTFNGAIYHGSMGGHVLNAPIVGIASTPDGGGYWLAASDGGVFAFGNAVYSGGEVGQRLNGAIVGIAGGPSNDSYWLVAADGGVFAFGGAPYYGSMGGFHLSAPIVAVDTTPHRTGYYLLGADGGVFTSNSRDGSFGTAVYYGGMAGTPLSAPMTSIAVTSDNTGYYLAAGDGGVFTFPRTGGNAPPFYGSLGSAPIEQIVSILPGDNGQSYRLVGADAATYVLGTPTPSVNEGVLLHISQVEKNFVDLTVTLTVDEKARDLMTLDSVYQRDKQANDPALRPKPYHMNSIQTFDNIPVFDCESGAGIIPRMGVFAHLWNVIHIPAAATGTIGQMKLSADDPNTQLAMAVFDRAVTANQLASAHGNPLTDINFWTTFGENSGLIIGWGSVDQPGGYFPGSFTEGNSPTGVLVDNASWYYQTTSSPWLWVAILADRTTFVQGQLLPAVGTG